MHFLSKKLVSVLMIFGSLATANSAEMVASGTSFLGLILSQQKPCDEYISGIDIQNFEKINMSLEKLNPEVCFSKRKKQDNRKVESDRLAYASDVDVCKCLSRIEPSEKDQGLVASEALVALQNAKARALRNEISFQASTIAPEMEDLYVRSEDRTIETNGKVSQKLQETSHKIIYEATIKGKNKEDPLAVKMHSFFGVLEKNQRNPDFDDSLYGDSKDKSNDKQCITSREFLGFNTIPKTDNFFNSLNEMVGKEFKESEWDIGALKEKLKSMKNDPNKKKEKQEIAARLRFLNKNPLIRNLFSLKKSKIEESMLSDERKSQIQKNGAWSELPELKERLFNTILKLAPKTKCNGPSTRSCLNQVADSKTMSEYRNSLADLFGGNANKSLADLLVWENENNLVEATINPFYLKPYEGKWMNFPQSQIELNQFLQSSDNLSTMQCFPGNIVDGNNVKSEILNSCRSTFQKYCPFVQVAAAQESNLKRKQTDSDLEESEENYSWISDLETNMEKNSKMLDFNDSICHVKRKLDPSLQPKGMNLPSSLSYSDFKNTYCKTDEKCRDNTKLLPYFMKLYPSLSNQDENDVETEAEIKAFASYIDKNDALKGRSAEKVESMKTAQISSSDRATRSEKSANKIVKMREFAARTFAEMLSPNGSTDSSSGGFFDSLKNILPSFSAPESADNSASGYNSYQGVTPTSTVTESKATEISSKMNDETEEKNELKEKLSDTQEQLRNAKSRSEKQELENRMAMLEQRLKDKDEAIAKYQKMLDSIKNNSTADNSQESANSARNKRTPASEGEDAAQSATSNKSQNINNNQNNQVASVTPATKNDNNSVSSNKFTPTSFGSNSSGASERSKSSNLNDVLLAKYGIVVDGKDNEQVILGKDKEPKDLMRLEVATKTGQNLELKNVSLDVYSGFESKNDETLKNYVKMVESMPASVVKVSVSTPGRSQVLQFYAIKESGKVVFQPIRTASLKNLKSELQDNR